MPIVPHPRYPVLPKLLQENFSFVRGESGTLVYLCGQGTDKEPFPGLPNKGDLHPEDSSIRCLTQTFEPAEYWGPKHIDNVYRVTCEYGKYSRLEDKPILSWRGAAEALEVSLGRRWADTGTICDNAQTIYYPNLSVSYSKLMATDPINIAKPNIAKVNHTWLTLVHQDGIYRFEPETLLFECPSSEAVYDYDRNCYIYRVTYNFLYRPMSHNVVYRQARQAIDEYGNPIVAANGDPVFVAGAAGKGGWAKQEPWLYAIADFGPMMGLPPTVIIRPYGALGAGLGG